jgi:hypothetical protein
VYRRHELPIRCARCKVVFEDEPSVQNHLEELESCQVIKTEDFDGYNKEQEKQLRRRKRPPNQTEEDKWFEMYRILFPEDEQDSLPSPCKIDLSCRCNMLTVRETIIWTTVKSKTN